MRRGKGAGEGSGVTFRCGRLAVGFLRARRENVRKAREAINRAVTRSEPAAESLQIAG